MTEGQTVSEERRSHAKKRRDWIISILVGIGFMIFVLILSASESGGAPPIASTPLENDPENLAVEDVYVHFVVDSGLTVDNVQAQTGVSETQIKESIRRCMRYNMSLINRPGPLQNGIDCRNVSVDMALFRERPPPHAPVPAHMPGSSQATLQQSPSDVAATTPPASLRERLLGISRGLPTREDPGAHDNVVERLVPLRDRAVDAIKRFESERGLTEDELAALTGKTEDSLERRVGSCYAINQNCDGQREVQSAIDGWEVSKAQIEAARRDEREAEAAAASSAN